jgi:tetratricopeptide (TPR) repeat protein
MALILLLLLLFQSADEDLYRRGVMLLKQNSIDEASRALEQAARQQPDWPFVWLAMADVRLRQKRFAEAEECAQKAGRLAPADPAIARGQGMLHARLAQAVDRPESAVGHWKEAIRLDPQHEAYRLALGQFLLDKRAEKAAEVELRDAVAAFPKNPELHRLFGLALYSQGRNVEAIDAFITAIDLAPHEESYYAGLETLLPDAGDRISVIRDRLRKFISGHPDKALGPYLLALVSPDQREGLLRQAIAIDMGFWPAYFELHKLVWQRGDIPEAIRLLEQVLKLNPSYTPAHYRLGQAYAKAGNREAARRAFEAHHRLTAKSH